MTTPTTAVGSSSSSQRLFRVALTAGFIAVAAGFHLWQPYERLFFSHEPALQVTYLAGRLLFCFYLFAILFSLGNLIFVALARQVRWLGLSPLEEVAISVVCGSAALRLGMFVLGFAGLYHWWLLAAIAVGLVWLGARRFGELARSISSEACQGLLARDPDRPARLGLSLALITACTIVVAYKFLLPNGTGDYFSHYLPYYQAVTARGDLWPNNVWYHFYVSKGAGDTFFAIILSDPLGTLAVSCTMFFTALVITYCLVRRGTADTVIALAAAALTAIGMIWTVETAIGFRFWAEFAKEHLTTSVLFLGCFWAVWRHGTLPAAGMRPWARLTALAFVGLVLLRVQFGAISLVLLALVASVEYLTGRTRQAWDRLLPAIAIIVSAAALLIINYLITGLAEVTPFRTFWRFADQAKFAQWVSPFLMLLLESGSSQDLGSITPPDLSQYPALTLLSALFRLDRLSPLLWPYGLPLAAAMLATLVLLWRRANARQFLRTSHAGICCAVIVSAALLFLAVSQLGSLFRLYTFLMFPVVALGVLPFAICRAFARRAVRTGTGMVLAALLLIAPISEFLKVPTEQRVLAGRFLIGRADMAEAYEAQNAVWPAALKMSAIVEPGAPIWISQVGWHFCIAPVCNLQSFFSFSMGTRWAAVMFEPAEIAEAALKKEHIDYFAIDTSAPFFDLLPYSPLFRPETMQDYFGLLWTDETVYLLTWRSDRTKPLPREFFEGLAKSTHSATRFADFQQLHARLADVYAGWKADRHWPVKIDDSLPRVRGWQ